MTKTSTLTALETKTTMITPVLYAITLEELNISSIRIGNILMLCKTLPWENLRRMTVTPSTAPSVRYG